MSYFLEEKKMTETHTPATHQLSTLGMELVIALRSDYLQVGQLSGH